MNKRFSMRHALGDPHLLGGLIDGDSWRHWRAMLIGLMGEALDDDERALFREITGRDAEPGERVEEFWAVIGRRGGKTRAASVLAGYLTVCVDWRGVLAPGEPGVLAVFAATTRQSAVVLAYISAIFADKSRPIFNRLLANETQETIELKNNIVVEVRPASFKTSRGITCISIICDEIAFWSSGENAANPDTEVLNALRPSLATTGGILCAISSPYARKGDLWSTYAAHFGPTGDPKILVAQAASIVMNPGLPERVVTKALAKDRSAASAEYLALFRQDLESFIGLDKIEAAIRLGRESLPYQSGDYFGFVDPAGGSGQDSMTMAIARKDGDRIILVFLDEARPPFSPDEIVERFAAKLKEYKIYKCQSDKYAGDWPAERFKKLGITVETSAEPKSIIYGALLPVLNAGRVELLDNARLRSQLAGLERRVNPGGRDTIDHSRGAHDDCVNAAAGAIVLADHARQPFVVTPEMLQRFSRPWPGTDGYFKRHGTYGRGGY